jgi:hypothetical protein
MTGDSQVQEGLRVALLLNARSGTIVIPTAV